MGRASSGRRHLVFAHALLSAFDDEPARERSLGRLWHRPTAVWLHARDLHADEVWSVSLGDHAADDAVVMLIRGTIGLPAWELASGRPA